MSRLPGGSSRQRMGAAGTGAIEVFREERGAGGEALRVVSAGLQVVGQ